MEGDSWGEEGEVEGGGQDGGGGLPSWAPGGP